MKYRIFLTTTHVILAGFFLPVAVMFSVTGALYTFGIKGAYETKNLTIPLELPTTPSLSEAVAAAEAVLAENGRQDLPSGTAGIKKMGSAWQLEWTGANFDFILEPSAEAGQYKAAIKDTTWHRRFVQLHKAKGGLFFKVLAASLAVGFLLLFGGGVLLAFSSPTLRRKLYWSFALGVLTFAAAVAGS